MMEKQYSHSDHEKKLRDNWEQEGLYAVSKDNAAVENLFSVDTPPPTVSGNLHIGHIFSYTHTDITARFERMQGKKVFYPMGFDDNGLATERFVEKKHGITAYQLGREKFIALCNDETALAREVFKQLWQKLGLSVDWKMHYSTISKTVRALSQQSFIALYKNNHIYRKYEPALFCTTCRTSVAQADLEDVEQSSFFNTIVFHTADNQPLYIATTRPELLPSCVAIFYHPDDQRYTHLKGTFATVPLFGMQVPLLPDSAVSPEKGTGLVMCCAFGDKQDVAWIRTHNLAYTLCFDQGGRFKEHTGELAGLKVVEARKKVLELLSNGGFLKEQKPITHAVNVHERCKKEIEYVPLSQWFLRILDNKEQFIKLADQIEWQPAFMKARYVNWVENIHWDWCLSRQRLYGIPFPVWHCADCGHSMLAPVDALPIDPQETKFFSACTSCKGTHIVPDTDVMDTWNTSSLTPYICAQLYHQLPINSDVFHNNAHTFLPMSMRPQAHDIIRTWAFYTIIKAWLHNKTIPWKAITISGHVLSENREKFSKSKDQKKLDPHTLLDTYSADVIRYWTASGNLGHDVQFSEMQLKIGQRLVTKLWNAFRFIQEHATIHNENLYTKKQESVVNAWIMQRLHETYEKYITGMQQREISDALQGVEKFFWDDVCDNYLEMIKHQLFNPQYYQESHVAETKQVLGFVGYTLLQMYAPYMPFVTDALYCAIFLPYFNKESIHITQLMPCKKTDTKTYDAMPIKTLLALIVAVRKLKTEQQLSLKTPIQKLLVYGVFDKSVIQNNAVLLQGVCGALSIECMVDEKTKTELVQVDDQWIAHVVLAS